MDSYRDATRPIADRVADLLSRMTLREKAGQMNQKMLGWQALERRAGRLEPTRAFEEEVALGDGLGALYGLFRADPWSGVNFANGLSVEEGPGAANRLQRYVLGKTRLGIPLLFSEECPHGHQALDASIFPTSLAVGCTWNPELYRRAYEKAAAQMRARGATLALVSCLDIAQDPRWGRCEECYGEDPYLAGRFAAAAVRGLQGEGTEALRSPQHLAMVAKHFCAQGAALGGHNGKHTVIGERELREIHLPPMEQAIRAGVQGCMAAYNDIDGVYCHANRWLLTDLLRDELGFEGVAMSDGCAIDILRNIAGDYEGAARLAAEAGVDMNLWSVAYTRLEQAVKTGVVREETLDRAVERILALKFRLGLFENPYVDETLVLPALADPETEELNRQEARECAVLLKNNGILPLCPGIRRLAVIGPNADHAYNQLGDYTPAQRPGKVRTIYQGLRDALPACQIELARGCAVREKGRDGFPEAVEAARRAEAVVLVLGGSSARESDEAGTETGAAVAANLREMNGGEGADYASLTLDGEQRALARAVLETGTPVVAVLVQGRPHVVEELAEGCAALLRAWYPGTQGGDAVAEILTGACNPSGHLSISIPRSAAQLPVYYNYKSVDDYCDMTAAPRYPFGFGLSYTTYAFREIRLSRKRIGIRELERGETIQVEATVGNQGERGGYAVAQLYMHALRGTVTRRHRELKGFEKIWLAAGESRTVRFELGWEALREFGSAGAWTVEAGPVDIYVGESSMADEKATLTIEEDRV